jgi:hypothetical protein
MMLQAKSNLTRKGQQTRSFSGMLAARRRGSHVSVVGTFKDKAIVSIDGGKPHPSVGQSAGSWLPRIRIVPASTSTAATSWAWGSRSRAVRRG